MPTENETTPRQFRLGSRTLDQLDRIAAHLGARKHDGSPNRTVALEFAVEQAAKKIPKKSPG